LEPDSFRLHGGPAKHGLTLASILTGIGGHSLAELNGDNGSVRQIGSPAPDDTERPVARIIHVGTRSRKSLVGLRKPCPTWFARRALEAGPAKRPKVHQGLGLLVTTLHRHE
jgi:hypothetical protein